MRNFSISSLVLAALFLTVVVNAQTWRNTYAFFDRYLTWNEAQDFCVAEGGYLLDLGSNEEWNFFFMDSQWAMFPPYTFPTHWVGLRRPGDYFHPAPITECRSPVIYPFSSTIASWCCELCNKYVKYEPTVSSFISQVEACTQCASIINLFRWQNSNLTTTQVFGSSLPLLWGWGDNRITVNTPREPNNLNPRREYCVIRDYQEYGLFNDVDCETILPFVCEFDQPRNNTGACCLPDTCLEITRVNCRFLNGTFLPFKQCFGNICQLPPSNCSACCDARKLIDCPSRYPGGSEQICNICCPCGQAAKCSVNDEQTSSTCECTPPAAAPTNVKRSLPHKSTVVF
eukprot:TRINITY_DN751_c0_g1_i1.p1 TRINITY_DN751_c0_g1~~TRINITY_DN751_c0_g1_i1.p1  ORF type:complete len:343 (-),score=46.14 TRINITY_DN751_c0_g1_i1:37-1065(-)